jgi:hypothetical protein
MNLTQAQAFVGLRASATPTGTNVTNDVQIGVGNTVLPLTGATGAYSMRGFITSETATDFVFDLTDGDTTGTTAFVAGVQQVETAGAAGTITLAGDAVVVVTSTGMAGSPLTLNVPVALNDTAAQWAAKVRTALAANATIAQRFDVSGTSTAIILTRKPISTLSDGKTSVPIRLANDANLNISLNNGTCTGITPATTSENTTAGVATSGVFIVDGDGKDFEGVDITPLDTKAVLFENGSNAVIGINGNSEETIKMNGQMYVLLAMKESGIDCMLDSPYTAIANGPAILTITVVGQ